MGTEAARRAAREADDGVGGPVLGPFGDRPFQVGEHGGELVRHRGRQAIGRVLVRQRAVGDRTPGDLGEDGGDVGVAERLRAGDEEVGVGRLGVGQRR